MNAARYQWNAQEVAADVVDGEAVIINLINGTYYSLDQAGTVVWQTLGTPQSLESIAAALVARYDVARDTAHADADAFVGDLVREQLLLASAGEVDTVHPDVRNDAQRLAYAAPRLEKYTDMADMLALDPPLPGLKDIPWKTPSGK